MTQGREAIVVELLPAEPADRIKNGAFQYGDVRRNVARARLYRRLWC
jgi:hypothetical protein